MWSHIRLAVPREVAACATASRPFCLLAVLDAHWSHGKYLCARDADGKQCLDSSLHNINLMGSERSLKIPSISRQLDPIKVLVDC